MHKRHPLQATPQHGSRLVQGVRFGVPSVILHAFVDPLQSRREAYSQHALHTSHRAVTGGEPLEFPRPQLQYVDDKLLLACWGEGEGYLPRPLPPDKARTFWIQTMAWKQMKLDLPVAHRDESN